MKTIILKSGDDSIRVEAKVDIFATLEQLQEPGFDTRFTGMEILDSDEAIVAGVNLTEIEHNWQSIINLAKTLGYALLVVDLNGKFDQEVEIVEAA